VASPDDDRPTKAKIKDRLGISTLWEDDVDQESVSEKSRLQSRWTGAKSLLSLIGAVIVGGFFLWTGIGIYQVATSPDPEAELAKRPVLSFMDKAISWMRPSYSKKLRQPIVFPDGTRSDGTN
jgi:hypothetical protein